MSDFIAAYRAAREPLLASPHALSFDMCRCVDEPTALVLRIEWTLAEDHLERFRKSDAFRPFFAHVKPFIGDIEEMRHHARPGM